MARFWTKLALLGLLLIWASSALAQVHVRGYYRKNGTYVAPHYRSSPNHTRLDNWSTKGNINPYTGKPGTRNPYPEQRTYTPPTYYPRSYTPAFRRQAYRAPAYHAAYDEAAAYARPEASEYVYTSPMWGRAPVTAPSPPAAIRWYRCDDPDGSCHYSHRAGAGCVYVGSSNPH